MVSSSRVLRHAGLRGLGLPAAAAEQLLVVGAQLASGVSNFVFSIVMAHVLAPGDFTLLRAFLALYLVVHIPTGSISAGAALRPELGTSAGPRILGTALGISFAILICAVPLGNLVQIPVPMVIALAATVPAAGLLALKRGRLWGTGRHGRGAASLLVDAGGRFVLGVALGAFFGPLGAAVGVVLGGYAALALVSELRSPGVTAAPSSAAATGTGAGWTMVAFLLLALVQNQDLLFANKLLPVAEAARFAGISTLGGIAVFASTGLPTLLLPRAARGEKDALRVALLLAALLGGLAVAITAAAPDRIAAAVLGERYASAGSLLVPYMAAMAVFGIGRVLVAQRCARGGAAGVTGILAIVALIHGLLLAGVAEEAADVVVVTLGATVVLCLALAAVVFLPRRPLSLRMRVASIRSWFNGPRSVLSLIFAGALGLRLFAPRGLWVDEAITVAKAQMPFGRMLADLGATDVHPPLHYIVMWGTTRLFGTGELAVRLPSMLAGALLVPVLYALTRDLFDRRTALVAAAMASVSPLLIWYSQEARMYGLLMLFSAVAVWAQVRALDRESGWGWWLLFALATIAMLWTQYFAVLLVGVQQLVFLGAAVHRWRAKRPVRSLLSGWILSALLIAGALLPLVPFAMEQLQANQARYANAGVPANVGRAVSETRDEISVYTLIANSVWAMVGFHSDRAMSQIVALWPLGMAAGLALLGRGRPSRSSLFLLACAVVPILALFAAGFMVRNLFEVRYFVTAVPLMVVLSARLLTRCASRPLVMRGAAALVIAVLAIAGIDQQVNGTNPRIFDFRGALQELSARASPGDTILYQPQFLDTVVGYYAPEQDAHAAGTDVPRIEPGRRVFLIGSFLSDKRFAGSTGGALAALDERYVLVDEFERPQVRVWVFERPVRSPHAARHRSVR